MRSFWCRLPLSRASSLGEREGSPQSGRAEPTALATLRRLVLLSEPADFSLILEGFKEVTYLDEQGKPRKSYELNEIASYQILLRYSPKHRAMFLLQFKAMKDAVLDMFKLKVLLPEHKGNVKVDVGSNPIKRLEQLQTGSDAELSLVYTSFLISTLKSIMLEVSGLE